MVALSITVPALLRRSERACSSKRSRSSSIFIFSTSSAWGAEAAEGEAKLPARFVEVVTAAILQLASLEQNPDAFVRIEVEGRGGPAFTVKSRRRTTSQDVVDRLTPMDGRTIPHHQPCARNLAQELAEEGTDRRPPNGPCPGCAHTAARRR